MLVKNPIDCHLFHPPIPKLQLFQNLKIQGQGHGESLKWPRHPINSHPFHLMSMGPRSPEIQLSYRLY